jgi:phosphatidylserine/phosphatidylglycerophosphate/cardiolipin synthase-like enzyme
MMQQLEIALRNKVKVIVVTRPTGDLVTHKKYLDGFNEDFLMSDLSRLSGFGEKEPTALQGTLDMLQHAGVNVVFRSNIHQKFALIDQKVVWYGSINLLSFGSAEESIMRLESPNIASELLKSMEKQGNRQ